MTAENIKLFAAVIGLTTALLNFWLARPKKKKSLFLTSYYKKLFQVAAAPRFGNA